jgi:hypothetical protein
MFEIMNIRISIAQNLDFSCSTHFLVAIKIQVKMLNFIQTTVVCAIATVKKRK